MLIPRPACLALVQHSAKTLAQAECDLAGAEADTLRSKRQGPLGRYFEALVFTCFAHSPDIQTVYSNVAVRDGNETKGEFDLLYQRQDRWHHLEMAIKFYLGVGDLTDAFNWHGPALRDTLGRKIKRIQGHQLPLAKSVAGKQVLEGLGIAEISSEALVLGRLFHPAESWQAADFTVPPLVSGDHARGWWCHVSDLQPAPHLLWQKLSRPEWLTPVYDPNTCRAGGPDRNDLQRPTQFAVFSKNPNGEIRTAFRVFVVPDNWLPEAR